MTTIEEYAAGFREDPGYLNFAGVGPIGDTVVAEERAQAELFSRARFGSLPAILDQE